MTWWVDLREIMASNYPTWEQSRRVVMDAGLNPAFITFSNQPMTNWHNILEYADNQKRIQEIAAVAAKESPNDNILKLFRDGLTSPPVPAPDFKDVEWHEEEPGSVVEEKILGKQSNLLDISYLETGIARSRSVCRVERADGTVGSGFLIRNNLLITNHHVLPDAATAQTARIQFNYQRTVDQLDAPANSYTLEPSTIFATSPREENDWTVVKVSGEPNDQWGALSLEKVSPKRGDRVTIIQHPSGGPKQIALHHNAILFVNANRIQYLTDTLPGSSGSPGFDMQWRVVSLHRSGGWIREPGTKNAYYRNEGVHINAVIDGLKTIAPLLT